MLDKFFRDSPAVIDAAIATVLVTAGIFVGLAINKADSVVIGGENWLKIESQAVENQESLKRAVLLNRIQQSIITRQEEQLQEFARRYTAAEDLAEQAKFAANVVPDHQIAELEIAIGKSMQVLDSNQPE